MMSSPHASSRSSRNRFPLPIPRILPNSLPALSHPFQRKKCPVTWPPLPISRLLDRPGSHTNSSNGVMPPPRRAYPRCSTLRFPGVITPGNVPPSSPFQNPANRTIAWPRLTGRYLSWSAVANSSKRSSRSKSYLTRLDSTSSPHGNLDPETTTPPRTPS